ncbi:IBR finger domain-containing protein [Rutstroemia sp. NJR-2017a BBW]|nr:IBR finger domain-containing protein [Rutstroemia sp. NJR-2017a BBW]
MDLDNEPSLQDADEHTLALIIEIQRDDVNQYASKGKQREGEMSDEALAIQMQREELDRVAIFLSDRRMIRSISDAVQVDTPALIEVAAQEVVAIQDRELATELDGGAPMPSTSTSQTDQLQTLDDVVFTKLQTLYAGRAELSIYAPTQGLCDGGQAEPSSRAVSRKEQTEVCGACRDEVNTFELARAPCGHVYCRTCLRGLFEAAMTDESLFPPRCCRQHISPEEHCILLTAEIIQRFDKKKIEFSTINRTYCCIPTCSSFIAPQYINSDIATCPDCSATTCAICKAAHEGDCPNDVVLQRMLEVARENGWQRCHACRAVVELDHGCNHITCRCGAQFCYVCGERWRTCTCAQWHEDRLLARANQNVDREQLPAEQLGRNAQVAAQVEYLRENHECTHDRWDKVNGVHNCEACYEIKRVYIYRCRHCLIQACNACRRHRL